MNSLSSHGQHKRVANSDESFAGDFTWRPAPCGT